VLTLKGRYEARGLRVVSVTGVDDDADAAEAKLVGDTAREEKMTYPCFLDVGSSWQRAAGSGGAIPTFFVVGRDGRIVRMQTGRLVDGGPAFAMLEAAIKKALGS
jgi:hypothetical protein